MEERILHSTATLGCEEICKGNRGFGYTLLHSWARSRSQAFVTRIICTRTAARGWFRDLNIRRDLDHFTCSFPREVTRGTKTAFLCASEYSFTPRLNSPPRSPLLSPSAILCGHLPPPLPPRFHDHSYRGSHLARHFSRSDNPATLQPFLARCVADK